MTKNHHTITFTGLASVTPYTSAYVDDREDASHEFDSELDCSSVESQFVSLLNVTTVLAMLGRTNAVTELGEACGYASHKQQQTETVTSHHSVRTVLSLYDLIDRPKEISLYDALVASGDQPEQDFDPVQVFNEAMQMYVHSSIDTDQVVPVLSVDLGVHVDDFEQITKLWSVKPQYLAVDDLQWHEHTAAALDSISTANHDDLSAYKGAYVYVDGSKLTCECEPSAAWAMVIVFFDASGQLYYGGSYSGMVCFSGCHWIGAEDSGADVLSMQAEASGVVWALLWALQCPRSFDLHLLADNCPVLNAALGSWGWANGGILGDVIRSLMMLVQKRNQLVAASHVKAHTGSPWNEYVDVVAKAVASKSLSPHVPDCNHVTLLLTDRPAAIKWLWYVAHSSDDMPGLDRHGVLHHSVPQTEVQTELLQTIPFITATTNINSNK